VTKPLDYEKQAIELSNRSLTPMHTGAIVCALLAIARAIRDSR
jgi:hypothetical protein